MGFLQNPVGALERKREQIQRLSSFGFESFCVHLHMYVHICIQHGVKYQQHKQHASHLKLKAQELQLTAVNKTLHS